MLNLQNQDNPPDELTHTFLPGTSGPRIKEAIEDLLKEHEVIGTFLSISNAVIYVFLVSACNIL